MEDFYYKSNEVFIHCDRCGYCYERWIPIDKARGKRIKSQVTKFIKNGRLNEAIKAAGMESWTKTSHDKSGNPIRLPIMEWEDEEKIKHLQSESYDNYYKKDNDGNLVYIEKASGGYGCYTYGKGGVNSVGSLKKGGLKVFVKAAKENLDKYDVLQVSFKRRGEWFKLDIKTGEEELMIDDFHVEVKKMILGGRQTEFETASVPDIQKSSKS